MELSYWISRWNKGKTGFHMENGYPGLVQNWNKLNLPPNPVVLVPLAGKSRDILWLSRHSQTVIAVEISERAIHQFFEENNLTPTLQSAAGFDIYTASNITFWHGDFLKLPKRKLPPADLIFDKAAIVALPPQKRIAYAKKILSLSTEQTLVLMHLLNYPEGQMTGPPFSVTKEEVEKLFDSRFRITELERNELNLSNFEKFSQRGLKNDFFEYLLLLSRNKSI